MRINQKITEADFTISDSLTIRFKKGYGFYLLKKIDNQWLTYTKEFSMNTYAIGFKGAYGFSFKDLKPFLFKTFNEVLSYTDKVDNFTYWEYNQSTHRKIGDTIMKKKSF